MRHSSFPLIAAFALLSWPALAQHGHGHGHEHAPASPQAGASPYAGLQARAIKALSDEEQRAWLEGQGARQALPAELNGHPGPMHVLEHARALGLSAGQEQHSRELMERHKAEVRALGGELVELERRLDRLFAERRAGDGSEAARLAEAIGTLAGRIRASHLRTHVQQTALLSSEQVATYQRLRGYQR